MYAMFVCTQMTYFANWLALLHQVNNATARVMTKKTAVAPTIPNGKTSISNTHMTPVVNYVPITAFLFSCSSIT